jgi:hypothetical protein
MLRIAPMQMPGLTMEEAEMRVWTTREIELEAEQSQQSGLDSKRDTRSSLSLILTRHQRVALHWIVRGPEAATTQRTMSTGMSQATTAETQVGIECLD